MGPPRAAAYAPWALRRALAVALAKAERRWGSGGAKPPGQWVARGRRARRSGAGHGAPASDGDGGSGGAKPPGQWVARRRRARRSGAGHGAPASDGDGGSGGAKPPGERKRKERWAGYS